MNDILSWLTLIISAVSTLCTLVLSWILFKKEQNKTYLKERYELVISPYSTCLKNICTKRKLLLKLNKPLKNAKILLPIINLSQVENSAMYFLFH